MLFFYENVLIFLYFNQNQNLNHIIFIKADAQKNYLILIILKNVDFNYFKFMIYLLLINYIFIDHFQFFKTFVTKILFRYVFHFTKLKLLIRFIY